MLGNGCRDLRSLVAGFNGIHRFGTESQVGMSTQTRVERNARSVVIDLDDESPPWFARSAGHAGPGTSRPGTARRHLSGGIRMSVITTSGLVDDQALIRSGFRAPPHGDQGGDRQDPRQPRHGQTAHPRPRPTRRPRLRIRTRRNNHLAGRHEGSPPQ